MNEQNRLRLERITSRYGQATRGRSDAEGDVAFLNDFRRVGAEILQPVMDEVGLQLRRAGYDFQVTAGGDDRTPSIDLHVVLPDRGDSKDTIRFFARKYADKGWQVIAELELKRSPVELKRFGTTEPISREVAEQVVVDGVEQMFASTEGRR